MKSGCQPLLSKPLSDRRVCSLEVTSFESVGEFAPHPLPGEALFQPLSLARRDHNVLGLIINPKTHMAWRPYENLINGELDNRTPGKVIGWMRFFRSGQRSLKVRFDLTGDFHEDIRGKVLRLSSPSPKDRNGTLDRDGTYMKGFGSVRRGEVGDITAGISLGLWTESLSQKLMAQHELFWEQSGTPDSEREKQRRKLAETYRQHIERQEPFYPYVDYPYIEWYSEANGRVVLEVDPKQVEIVDGAVEIREKTAPEMLAAARTRTAAFGAFLNGMATELFDESRSRDRAGKPAKANT
jgi:hypothetical protein